SPLGESLCKLRDAQSAGRGGRAGRPPGVPARRLLGAAPRGLPALSLVAQQGAHGLRRLIAAALSVVHQGLHPSDTIWLQLPWWWRMLAQACPRRTTMPPHFVALRQHRTAGWGRCGYRRRRTRPFLVTT